jgi:ATP-dependent Lon protease
MISEDTHGKNTLASVENGGGETITIPGVLPVMLLNDVVIFPNTIVPVVVSDEKMVKLVNDALSSSRMLATFTRITTPASEKPEDQFYHVGTASQILKMFRVPDGTMRLLVQGLLRIERKRTVSTEPYLVVEVEPLSVEQKRTLRVEALMRRLSGDFNKLAEYSQQIPEEVKIAVYNINEPGALADIIASNLNIPMATKQRILEETRLEERLSLVVAQLSHELKIVRLGSKIQSEVESEIDQNQREYYLREQMKAIRKELGEEDDVNAEVEEFQQKIKAAEMPQQALDAAHKELDRLKRMSTASSEYTVSRTYLEWLVSLPWNKASKDELDLDKAEKTLNRDHYGLSDVKNRILEFLAVRKLKQTGKGPILCFVGPPGVGKTSLGKSIASAMKREFVRMSLGGMRDEAEIRGHRRTYVGALPGRIIQSVRRVAVNNPVMMLDEIDKLGSDFRGDPASALLEVLDPAQNSTFQDHYLDVEFDLSKVFFITTANDAVQIPSPLRDRMEIIEISSYITDEKVQIARDYLVPRQVEENGLKKSDVRFSEKGLAKIIEGYTREAGVRKLEQQIAAICRKVARSAATGKTERCSISEKNVEKYLGPPHFQEEMLAKTSQIGVAHGLAWTPVGGDVLVIESTWMPGAKQLQVTGRLGDVMKESAQIALSYLRAHADHYHLDNEVFSRRDIHIHVPEGATPKDGPSAGITITTSLASLFMNRPVMQDLGMTGEITLSGNILPVGGLREKIVAASRAGLKILILPKSNEKDLYFVPEHIKKRLKFHFVENIAEVLKLALMPPADGKEKW